MVGFYRPGGYPMLVLWLVLLGGCSGIFETHQSPDPALPSQHSLAQQWFEIANLYASLGDLAAAEAAFKQSLALGMDQRARHNLGLVQVRMGMESLATARGALPSDPQAQAYTREYLQTLLDEIGAPAHPMASEAATP